VILVVGLGNPGPRYAETRHNVGFRVVDELCSRGGGSFRERFHGEFAAVGLFGTQLGLLKPMTFMNESGRSVQPAAQFLKVPPSSLLIIHDELDLPFGELRLKSGGGDAGHRGLKSISQALGPASLRLRVGIGRPPPDFRGAVADFVLQGFSPAERADLPNVVDRAAEAVALVATRGIEVAMNATNQRSPR
jgi:PTH1 family peptidyl-tRNA hydrolase